MKISTFLETVIKPEITKDTYLKIEDLTLYAKYNKLYMSIKGDDKLIMYAKEKALYYSYIRQKHYEDNPVSQRKRDFLSLKNLYPDKIPTILVKDQNMNNSKELNKFKYMLP